MIIGYVFKWYRHLDGALFVAIEYVGVYIFVWLLHATPSRTSAKY